MPHHKKINCVLSDNSGPSSLALPLLVDRKSYVELNMLKPKPKKNPLTKAQAELLRVSLKRLLGEGLIKDSEKERDIKRIILKDALNALLLE